MHGCSIVELNSTKNQPQFDRRTGERQTKQAKLIKAVSRRYRRAVEEIRQEGWPDCWRSVPTQGSRSGRYIGSISGFASCRHLSRVLWPFWKQQKGSRKHRGPKPRNASSQVECSHKTPKGRLTTIIDRLR